MGNSEAKILFVLPNVNVGGVERVTITLLEQFAIRDIKCHLALRNARGELIEQARSAAAVHELAPKGIHQFVPALTQLIKEVKPTCVVSAFSDVGALVWLAIKLSGKKNIRWVHSVHNTHGKIGSRPGLWGSIHYWLENQAGKFCYRFSNNVVSVSQGVADEVTSMVASAKNRSVVIYNPVVSESWLRPLNKSWPITGRAIKIVALGRLVKQKGFDLLIQTMSNVQGNWTLEIWGSGPEHESLANEIKEAGLDEKVFLRGYTDNPYKALSEADVYVMSSRHEGLGNTLIEAMACQCQLISTDCEHGPREILENGVYGALVPPNNISALTAGIQKVINNELCVASEVLLARAKFFSTNSSVDQWLDVVNKQKKH